MLAVTVTEESSVPQCPNCRLVRARCFDSNLLQAKFMLLRLMMHAHYIECVGEAACPALMMSL